MNSLRFGLVCLLSVLLGLSVAAQKLQSDGFSLKLKEYEEGQVPGIHGVINNAYGALVIVKSKDDLKGTYYITLVQQGDGSFIVIIRDESKALRNPMLLYDADSMLFKFVREKRVDEEVKLDAAKPMKENILQGLLLWLQVRRKYY